MMHCPDVLLSKFAHYPGILAREFDLGRVLPNLYTLPYPTLYSKLQNPEPSEPDPCIFHGSCWSMLPKSCSYFPQLSGLAHPQLGCARMKPIYRPRDQEGRGLRLSCRGKVSALPPSIREVLALHRRDRLLL